jgi:hypothetical protein
MIEQKHVESLVAVIPLAPTSETQYTLRELAIFLNSALLLKAEADFNNSLDAIAPVFENGPGLRLVGDNELDTPVGNTTFCTMKAMGIAEVLLALGASITAQANDPAVRSLSLEEIDSAFNAADEAFDLVEHAPDNAFEISTSDEIALCAVFAESREYMKLSGGEVGSEAINESYALQDRILGSKKK